MSFVDKYVTFRTVIALSVVVRVGLILYSEWHDAHSAVKYTDIDYRVFTDAAKFLLRPGHVKELQVDNYAKGVLGEQWGLGDPYTRQTYRYTPLLALILTPNLWFHPSFGKYLFAACDILVGVFIHNILITTTLRSDKAGNDSSKGPVARGSLERRAIYFMAIHLLSPFVFSISTRGSSESTLGALVIGTLYFAMHERFDAAAILLGISVHWKIYPVIYVTSLLAVMSPLDPAGRTSQSRARYYLTRLVNRRTIRFALLSGGTFLLLGGLMYAFWGYPFLYETYLYHLHRLDHRHNFSPYWYPIYLNYPTHSPPSAELWRKLFRSPLSSFVPQMTLSLGAGWIYTKSKQDLPLAWFVQTAVFVTFNKVCTSQYFLWYLTILPLVLPSLSMSVWKAIALVMVWVVPQALWLKTAYELEFLGKNVFLELWIKSIIFMLANCIVLVEIIKAYHRVPEQREPSKDKVE